jgi:CBS domain-containing protein
MRPIRFACVAGGWLASNAALAATQEEALANLTQIMAVVAVVFVIVVVAGVMFMRSRDRHIAPLTRLFERGEAIHSIEPERPVLECVRRMTERKIGALVVQGGSGEAIQGIFTERDALTKVLAAGLDPATTPVSAVMTRDPVCIPPTTTVGEAMELVTRRRFRHLPIVDQGRLLAVVSSGDLTRWLVQDAVGEVKDLVALASRT